VCVLFSLLAIVETVLMSVSIILRSPTVLYFPHPCIISTRSFSGSCARWLRFDPRRGRDPDDQDYDVHYESYAKPNYNAPVKGSYTEGYSGDPKEAARMDGQKNFEGFPLANMVGQYDYKHTPRHLLEKEFNYPLCEDRFGQRYPGYWIKKKFHYVKEMEPELIVPDLTDFPLKPYVSYRTNDLESPQLTARVLFNMVYADGIYKNFLEGQIGTEADDETESTTTTTEKLIEEAEAARTAAEKTGSDRFVPDSWYGIGVDKFD